MGNEACTSGPLAATIGELDLASYHCAPAEALERAKKPGAIDAAVVSVGKLSELEQEDMGAFLERMAELSIGILVLAREAPAPRGPGHKWGQLLCVPPDESPEMLKGRLATLVELRPLLQQLSSETSRLHHINQPLNQYFHEVDEEMRLAARLQRDFLPRALPEIDSITFATVYRPATWVSGDIYDLMRLDEEHLGFYVSDAVGHGVPAALLTMFIKRAIITKRITGHDYELVAPDEVLEKLNRELVDQNLSNFQFATACYGILNTRTLELRLASAGHPPPLLIDPAGQTRELPVGGALLGVFPEVAYQTETFQLHQCEKLLVFSDGVEVAFVNGGFDEPLRFRQEFDNLSRCDVKTMCEKLLEIIDDEEGPLHPRDDVTILGIELGKETG